MSSRSRVSSVPLVDWGKAVASQLIVLHHLVIYGPMAREADPLAPDVFAWLADPARLVVQLFLVIGGYLAARSLMPEPARAAQARWQALPELAVTRYWRLAKPALVALAAALLAALVARWLMDDPSTPPAPTWRQALANALFLQDIVGEDALTVGLWYVAIDLQLFVGLAVLSAGLRLTRLRDRALAVVAVTLVGGLVVASLCDFNRHADLDMWAIYFFGSYGLGVLAHWVRQRRYRAGWLLALAAVVGVALWVDWRSRIALAGAMAVWLGSGLGGRTLAASALMPLARWLSGISYEVFLMHYPVSLLVGAVVHNWWPDSLPINFMGLMAAWGLSLMAGVGLNKLFSRPATPRVVPAAASA